MSKMVEGCDSVHEPDLLSYHMPMNTCRGIREFGFFGMTLGKLSYRHSLRALGIARVRGKVSDQEAIKYLRKLRGKVLEKSKASIYLEANYQLSLLADLIPSAFPSSRVAYIVRDPRDWVASWMNIRGIVYSKMDIRSWLKNGRLAPYHFSCDPYLEKWKSMTRFEKLCWLWSRENLYTLSYLESVAEARVFRFEDLFGGSKNYEKMRELLGFITNFSEGGKARWEFNPKTAIKKSNSVDRIRFPQWREWTGSCARILDEHCGELMQRLNYGNEREWKELLGSEK